MDLFGTFVYLPYWLFAGVIVSVAVAGAALSLTVVRAGIALALAGWMLVLPSLRWNETKAFYIDCRQIQPGMDASDARAMMSAYRLQTASDGREPARSMLDRPHLTFHPSLDRSSDWCVVYMDREQVTGVELLPD